MKKVTARSAKPARPACSFPFIHADVDPTLQGSMMFNAMIRSGLIDEAIASLPAAMQLTARGDDAAQGFVWAARSAIESGVRHV